MSIRRTQLSLDLQDDLFVVGFAGGGGSCTGYALATGRNVDLACNHDHLALAMHRMNHPQTRHFPEDIRRWDLAKHVAGRRVGGAWYSPDCKHFSKAKGGKPKDKFIRGLAWVIIHEINQLGPLAPRVIFLENVEEFLTWGPLDRDGNIHRGWKGWFLRCFKGALERRGYHDVEFRVLRACDYGAPTIRKRLYMVARRDGQPVVWPAATHARPHVARRDASGPRLKPWRTFAECADWSLPCPSIFLTHEEGRKFRCKRPLVRATMARLAKGVDRFVLKEKRPFLVNLTHQGEGEWPAQSVDAPIKTITGANRGEKALVAPMIAHLQHGGALRPAGAPLHTVTASKKDCNVVAQARLAAAPFLARTAHGDVDRKGKRRGQGAHGVGDPLPTTCASRDLAAGVAFVARQFGTSTGHDAREPLKTIMSDGGGGKNQAGVAFLAQHNGGMVGHRPDKPLSTVTGKCSQQQLVGATIAAYYGNDEDGQGVMEPLRTTTTKERFGLGECFGAVPPFTQEMEAGARRVAAFLREHGVEFDGEFATVRVRGVVFIIVDIGMRMLTPRELFRAQGFPDDYVIDRGVIIDFKLRRVQVPLTKTAQIRMCGNSVSPPVAAALIAANLPEMSVHFSGVERMAA